mgnify:CR=1 FL=1
MLINVSLFVIFWIILYGFKISKFIGFVVALLLLVTYFFAYRFNLLIAIRFNKNFFLYLLWLLQEIVKSVWYVSKVIWSPKLSISPKETWIDVSELNNKEKILYANSITLTPGTYSSILQAGKLLVYAIDDSCVIDDEANKRWIARIKKAQL